MKRLAITLVAITAASQAFSEGMTTYSVDDSFEDVSFAIESAIVDRGLVVDYVSHVGEMLARTGADVGSDVKLYDSADVYIFCSAVISRKVMEADPMNIGYCPYGIFVADQGDGVIVGFRNYPDGAMQEVQTLLASIVDEAIGD